MRHRVLITSPIIPDEGIELLKTACEVSVTPVSGEDELIREINRFNAEAIYTRTEKITRRVVESCPGLRIIQANGIGIDHIDAAAAAQCGISVLNVPDVTPINVAEHAIALILALSRHMRTVCRQAAEGGIPYPYPAPLRVQRELEGKTLLVAGLGNIGRRVAKKALALDMRVLAYDPYVQGDIMEALGLIPADGLMAALGDADYVSLHLPDTAQTRHMMDTAQFSAMKEDAFFINVSRGSLVNEVALIAALQDGKIAGAGIDVFETEPLALDSPLLSMDNIILSPHCAGTTIGCNIRAALRAARSIMDALCGKDPGTLVNGRQLAQAGRSRSFLPKS